MKKWDGVDSPSTYLFHVFCFFVGSLCCIGGEFGGAHKSSEKHSAWLQ